MLYYNGICTDDPSIENEEKRIDTAFYVAQQEAENAWNTGGICMEGIKVFHDILPHTVQCHLLIASHNNHNI